MKLTHYLFMRIRQSPWVAKVKGVSVYLFDKHLLVTNLGISAGLSGVGDAIQQNYEIVKHEDTNSKRQYDFRRTFNMSVTGVSVGAVCHFWYNWLDKFLPGRSLSIACKKVLMDQLICSPATISTFFFTLAVVEGSSFKELYEEMKSKSWRLYLAEWIIWPPAQLVNFFFLPTRYRVLYDNTISLGYDVYTSYVKHEIPCETEGRGNLKSRNLTAASSHPIPVRTSGIAS